MKTLWTRLVLGIAVLAIQRRGCCAFRISSSSSSSLLLFQSSAGVGGCSRVGGGVEIRNECRPRLPHFAGRSVVALFSSSPTEENTEDNNNNSFQSSSSASSAASSASLSFPNKNLVLQEASRLLQRISWFSVWIQAILSVVSSTILLFTGNASLIYRGGSSRPSFLLSALGLTISVFSILWTWGNGTRLSRRLLRDITTTTTTTNPSSSSSSSSFDPQPNVISYQRNNNNNNNNNDNNNNKSLLFLPATPLELLRRAIRVQVTFNLVGLFLTLLAAEEIVGSLALKVLAAGNSFTPNGWVQPIDILIVQANTNTLLSHFASLALTLYFADRVRLLRER